MRNILLTLLTVVFIAGCGSHRHEMKLADETVQLSPNTQYTVASVTDESGFSFEEGEDSIDLATAMQSALISRLKEENLYSESADTAFTIKPTLRHYEPGNAFGRWLLPGVGSTELDVISDVYSPQKITIGAITTHNTVEAGGAYTIGAWRSVFHDAAEEIVTELKESMGLIEE